MPAKKNIPPLAAPIQIIPLDSVDPLAISIVAAHLDTVMGLRADTVADRPIAVSAYLPERRQFDASRIIADLVAAASGQGLQLGLTQQDLCIPIVTFVYGESQLGGRAAVVSLHRLAGPQREITYQRLVKISLHEVGHLLGLGHCWQPDCLMRFSRNLEQVDGLPMRFCPACTYETTRRIGALNRSGSGS